ncbi:hybrid sensor histidine kinase/response regulator transcription factor [Larkinella terrae]|uniref:hybrid sensor histidine kinase/response regulator transcription factor n=1 Tax=Larkinella terrae TaxID=2025311 RepID=UPI0014784285|nr:ATP-binding protein [Larkinella terrae]
MPAQTNRLPDPELLTDRQGLPQAFVPEIVQDRQGFIWMATRDGLARYDGNRFKVFQPDPDGRPSISFVDITRLIIDHHGKLWLISERGDIDQLDPVTEQFTPISKLPAFQKLAGDFWPISLHIDAKDRLWFMRKDGRMASFDLRSHRWTQSQSTVPYVRFRICSDRNGYYWVVTENGIAGFEERTGKFLRYEYQPGKPGSLPDRQVKGLFTRPNGDLILTYDRLLTVREASTGTFRTYPLPPTPHPNGHAHFTTDRQGAVYFSRHDQLFRFTDAEGPVMLKSGDPADPLSYLGVCIDQSDVLWVGTTGSGVRKYDLRIIPFQANRYQANFVPDLMSNGWLNGSPNNPIPFNPRLSSYNFRYTFDGQGRFWYNSGSSELYRVDLKAKKNEKIPFPVTFLSLDIGTMTCPLTTDPEGKVWAVFDSLAYRYSESQQRWETFPFQLPSAIRGEIRMLTVDEMALWLITSKQGLWRIDRKTGQSTVYKHMPQNPTSLTSNELLSIATDPDDPNLLWIGTYGSGICLFNKKTGACRRIRQTDGLPNNVIYSVIPDQHGDVWAGTNKGLTRINRRTLQIRNYTTEDGILADEFNRYHFVHLPDDQILMGGLEGITAFYPSQVQLDPFRPNVEITSLQINNTLVLPGPESPLRELPPQALERLELPYDQNFLTFEFSALQFNKHTKNRYRYQLTGLNTGWVENSRPIAVFTDLRPGSYTLRLNTTNTSGIWSPHIRTLHITIRPPWWASWWAYILYGLVIGGIAYALFQNYANRLRMEQRMLSNQREAEQLRALDAMKSRFFANVTHEFRTPLTLILSPMEQLLHEELEPRIQRRVSVAETQARQLLRLINQLMDFSKLEANMMTITESRGNPGQCVEQWLLPFRDQANSLEIDLNCDNQIRQDYWFDLDKLEQIVYNLVSNAIKFTPKMGEIRVSIRPQEPESCGFMLDVTDTGIGIPDASIPLIFNRYYQVDAGATAMPNRPAGTGIGLSLVKELVDCQQGQIEVESREGFGTTFLIRLPGRLAEPAEEAEKAELPSTDAVETATDETIQLLLVEDNAELTRFITESLPDSYQVRAVSNGLEGLNEALKWMPDLIISDVMMPVMDGYTLCQNLKTDLRTNHIPIILLTAKVSFSDRIEGLTQGADDYITKPFHVLELQLRVRNLLESKRRLRERIHAELTQTEGFPGSAPAESDPFLEQITALLEANLDKSGFRVEEVMRQTSMSRMSLHRKMKTLTGMSPGDFIRLYRLKRATQLLTKGHTIAETAYMVGFETPAHFSKMFRAQYQITPSQFMTQGKG